MLGPAYAKVAITVTVIYFGSSIRRSRFPSVLPFAIREDQKRRITRANNSEDYLRIAKILLYLRLFYFEVSCSPGYTS